jgi:acyl carrier protein
LEHLVAYWTKQLSSAPSVLELFTDRPRPAQPTFHGADFQFFISEENSSALAQLARQERATIFMVLLAAFQLLLARWSNQEDVVVGIPLAGRITPQTEDLIGFFVNTLPIRASLSDNPTFRELLRRVKNTSLEAHDHQTLPFEKLVATLKPNRDISRHPIFQVMFFWDNVPQQSLELSGLKVNRIARERAKSTFELSLVMKHDGSRLSGYFAYSTDLFERSTIGQMSSGFTAILSSITSNPWSRSSDLIRAKQFRGLKSTNVTFGGTPPEGGIRSCTATQAREYSPPQTIIQIKLAEIWAEILNIEQVGVHDNFFELGGHSVLMLLLIDRIVETFKVDISIRTLFEQQTIYQLASYIDSVRVET